VVFLALVATIIQYEKSNTGKVNIDFKTSTNEYRDLMFINKAQVQFSAKDIAAAQEGINRIINEKGKQRIRKQNESNFGAYLFSVPQNELDGIIAELKTFGVISSQTEQIDTSLVNLDYDTESARLASYENELTELDKVRFPSEQQNRRKESLHLLIRESGQKLDKLREQENVLLYITLRPLQRSIGWFGMVKTLVLIYLKWLGIFAIGVVLLFFGSKLVMYFLSALGVKNINTSGLGGGYTYGGNYSSYGRYNSRYGSDSRKRKVKRIYKDKSASSENKDDTEK
jgi:hypothetical protein